MLHSLLPENVELTMRLTEAPWRVLVDTGQLEQVILNLAINAADAMPQGGTLEMRVASARLEDVEASELRVDPGSYVALSVRDTGCGMSRELRLRIFEPFFSTKEGPKGTGLGLASVYGIVEQSGGYIVVDSEVGRGSTFTIHLPAVSAEPRARTKPPRLHRSEPTQSAQILVVEDETQVRRLLTKVLAMHGYQVLEACSGEEALRHIEEIGEHIDLLLTDVRMPDVSGVELASRFAQAFPRAGILLISGYSEQVALDRDLPEAAAFLAKPFTNDTLLRKLQQLLSIDPSTDTPGMTNGSPR